MKKSVVFVLCMVMAASLITGCTMAAEKIQIDYSKNINLGVTAAPYGEIAQEIKDDVKKAGYRLNITEYEENQLPNSALEGEALDINFFQTQLNLEEYNNSNQTKLKAAATVFFDKMYLFINGNKKPTVVEEGTVILLPEGDINMDRAIRLLEETGLFKLTVKSGKKQKVTIEDIIGYEKYNIFEVEKKEMPQHFSESEIGTIAVMPGSSIKEAGLNKEEAIVSENPEEMKNPEKYYSVVAVKGKSAKNKKTKVFLNALKTDKVKNYVLEKYEGAVDWVSK